MALKKILRCCVSIPFGLKTNSLGITIDFDNFYYNIIKPAVEAEGLMCLYSKEIDDYSSDQGGSAFGRIIYSDIFIADITTLNSNVIYELGVRHATRAGNTIIICEKSDMVPYTFSDTRAFYYKVEDNGLLSAKEAVSITNTLRSLIRNSIENQNQIDSPIFYNLKDFKGVNIDKQMKPPQLFFNYARADNEKVEPIYKILTSNGFAPWMDTKDLLPGERWFNQILSTIEKSDFFLAFLSPNSFEREGILREEILRGIEKWKSMIEDDIYFIPVLIEPCNLPNNLEGFQALNLYNLKEEEWLDKLKASINKGFKKGRRLNQI